MRLPARRFVLSFHRSRLVLPALLALLGACAAGGDAELRGAVEHRLRFYEESPDHYAIVSCRAAYSKDPTILDGAAPGTRTEEGVKIGSCVVRFEIPDYPKAGATLRFERELHYVFDVQRSRWTELRSRWVAEKLREVGAE